MEESNKTSLVTVATAQGPRSYQEDRFVKRHFVLKDNSQCHLLAVMDGHNGSEAAEFSQKYLSDMPSFDHPDNIEAQLKGLIAHLALKTREMESGSTISVACILEGHMRASVAILGDSPVIIVDQSGKINVSPEHNVRTNLKERRAAIKRGGRYSSSGYISNDRTGYGLQMSRALGDCRMGSTITHDPEIYSVTLGPQSFVIVASDGLLDPSHKNSQELIEKAVDVVKNGGTAHDLLAWAKARGLEDNATVLVWKKKK